MENGEEDNVFHLDGKEKITGIKMWSCFFSAK